MQLHYCQSCGMLLPDVMRGTCADGSKSPDYCVYCYEKGAFTWDCTLEEMITHCVPLTARSNPDMSLQEAEDLVRETLPRLRRWQREENR